jgi:hypothetical protein
MIARRNGVSYKEEANPVLILFLCTNGSFGFRLREETKEGFMSDCLFYNPPCILFIFENVRVC